MRLFLKWSEFHEEQHEFHEINTTLATCARKPKVPSSSPAATYVQR